MSPAVTGGLFFCIFFDFALDFMYKQYILYTETRGSSKLLSIRRKGLKMKTVVYAREYETGIAGVEGIFAYAAAGYEDQMNAADLLNAIDFAQRQEGEISEEEYIADDTGKIHAITIDDCDEYLKNF